MGKQESKAKTTMLSAILIGTATSILTSVIGAAITAWVISTGKAPQSGTNTAGWIILFLSAACGSWIASKMAEGKKLQTAMITGGAYLMILILMTALFFGGQYQGMGVSGIIVFGVCAIIAFLPTKNSPARGKRKRVYR